MSSFAAKNNTTKPLPGDIIKLGYLKKLKTMKKKYFVLRGDSADGSARLEYYDSEKKWLANGPPKRSITLKTCFNINKKNDAKQKWAIALYTKNDCFGIVLETEEEMEDWLKALLKLQIGEAITEGDPIKPNFEHVWQVTVCNKELGNRNNILGPYMLCLTDQTLSLIRLGSDDKISAIEFSLQKIRRCGSTDEFFFMEVGQCTVTGAGNFWMKVLDTNIAENMTATILNACQKCPKKELQPKLRNRSSSANEASKPIALMQQKRPTHNSGPGRERSDSMPSRSRTTSEGTHFPNPLRNFMSSQTRPYTIYSRGVSYSPPFASSPVSPTSAPCSTDSASSSLSMDGDNLDGQWDESGRYCPSLTPDEPVIMEENLDDYGPWLGEDEKLNNYVHGDTTVGNNMYFQKSCGFKSNSPPQGSCIDMSSSYGSSPLETSNYLSMSPADSREQIFGRNAINHSRGSSLVEDGYVPMTPAVSDDGYVNMDHGPNKNKILSDKYQSGDLSSSSSVTSGTPSADMKFGELDKMMPYFPTEEESCQNDCRPVRAYSVGSRPPNKNRSELIFNNSSERTRAFSVGSKNRPSNVMRMSLLHQQPLSSSSHSSFEPSDDMMIMDFSKKKNTFRLRKKLSSSERLTVPRGSVSTLSSTTSSYSTAEGSCMEVSPRSSPSLVPSPPKSSRYPPFLGKSPPKHALQDILSFNKLSPPVSGYPSPSLGRVLETEPGYVEMTVSAGTASPQATIFDSPKTVENNAYVEMKFGRDNKNSLEINKPRKETVPTYHPLSCDSFLYQPASAGNNKDDYLDMSLKRKISSVEDNNNSKVIVDVSHISQPDDYVEMNLSQSSKKHVSQDYMDMSGKPETQPNKDRITSLPITIQSAKEHPLNPVYSMPGRKLSSVTPPRISQTSNASRPFQLNQELDNDASIPGSVFPFNLTSPTNTVESYDSSPKCPVDGTSGTIKLSYDSVNQSPDPSVYDSCAEEDYVCYEPSGSYDEYKCMKNSPAPCRKTSAPPFASVKMKPFEKLLSGLGTSFCSLTVGPTPLASSDPNLSNSAPKGASPTVEDTCKNEQGPSRKSSLATGDKELHYASLDLMRSGSDNEDLSRTLKTQSSLTESSSASSPSPNLSADTTAFNYAEIDFVKSGSSQKSIH